MHGLQVFEKRNIMHKNKARIGMHFYRFADFSYQSSYFSTLFESYNLNFIAKMFLGVIILITRKGNA